MESSSAYGLGHAALLSSRMLPVLGLVGIQVLLFSNICRLVLPHAIYSYFSAIGVVARLVVLEHLMLGITACHLFLASWQLALPRIWPFLSI